MTTIMIEWFDILYQHHLLSLRCCSHCKFYYVKIVGMIWYIFASPYSKWQINGKDKWAQNLPLVDLGSHHHKSFSYHFKLLNFVGHEILDVYTWHIVVYHNSIQVLRKQCICRFILILHVTTCHCGPIFQPLTWSIIIHKSSISLWTCIRLTKSIALLARSTNILK